MVGQQKYGKVNHEDNPINGSGEYHHRTDLEDKIILADVYSAQHIPGLRWNAKGAWKRLATPLAASED